MNANTQPTSPPTTGQSALENSEERREPVTLDAYVLALRKASVKAFPKVRDIPQEERRVIRELIDAGLLSDARREMFDGRFVLTDVIVLTPAGANALVEWSDFLKRESWWYKIGDSFLRALWVLLGALCALLPDIIRSL